MPLNVQPLSAGRRLLRIVVMLALLAGSLGFAQLLVNNRAGGPPVRVTFPAPPGVSRLAVNDAPVRFDQQPYAIAQAQWPTGTRQFAAFCFPNASDQEPSRLLPLLFYQLTPLDPDQPLDITPAAIAGRRGWQVAAAIADDTTPSFAVMRLTAVNGYIVAFYFSGTGPMTDDDLRFFHDYCTRAIRIQVSPR